MATPTLIMAASAASAAGSVVQGISGFQQARFQSELAEQNADMARRRAEVQRGRLSREQRRRMGRARAIAGSRGVQVTGSPLEVLSDQAAEAAEERALVSFGGEVKAREQEARASAARAQGTQSLIGGFTSAAGTLAGGFAQAEALKAPSGPSPGAMNVFNQGMRSQPSTGQFLSPRNRPGFSLMTRTA